MTNLQWVKASERKPEKDGWVYLRFPNDNPAVIYYTNRDHYLPHSCEWLDESLPSIEGEEKVQECKSPDGLVVGLIDSLIAISNVLTTDDFLYRDGVWDALADLRASDNMKRLMNMGELEDAKAYIKEKQKEIDILSTAMLELSKRFKKESPSPTLPIKEEEKTVGQILKEARQNKGLTTGKVLYETGVSEEYLRKLEADELKTPSASVLWKLTQFYQLELKYILTKAGVIVKNPPPAPIE